MDESTFLFTQPSFLSGMARTFDLFGRLNEYNGSPSEQEADSLALMKDAQAIRNDMSSAMEKVIEHYPEIK